MSDMTIQNAIHCMKVMICEEVCEECDYYGKTGTDHCEADAVRMAIKALEEHPERKKGKWIDGKCSNCGEHAPFWSMASTYYESNFCPNCGADMRGEKDVKP